MNSSRIREVNQKSIQLENDYILYWMQAFRRFSFNHALDYALEISNRYNKELIVYEGLRMDYPYSSERFHRFILEGMCDNREIANKLVINYWCFVETEDNPAKGLLKKISQKACMIITDDYPAFIIPEQIENLSKKIECKLIAIDGNGIIPLNEYGETATQARFLRKRIHRLFSENFIRHSNPSISSKKIINKKTSAPFNQFSGIKKDISSIIKKIKFNNNILGYSNVLGGIKSAKYLLNDFIKNKIEQYENRNTPNSPKITSSSGLSPYIHFGHISIDEILIETLNSIQKEKWAPDLLNIDRIGQKDFFSNNEPLNGFIDELLTWRDIGFLQFWKNKEKKVDLEILPNWVKTNIQIHGKDRREYIYSMEEFESCSTHDPLWNLAQKELMITGRMHNYMRMLWGKKVIEWTKSYQEAFLILEELNHKYAYDGRDPNSYTGILWCFGLYDRPWFPERNILGIIRYMSSASTLKKFKMKNYLEYVEGLGGDGC